MFMVKLYMLKHVKKSIYEKWMYSCKTLTWSMAMDMVVEVTQSVGRLVLAVEVCQPAPYNTRPTPINKYQFL